MMPESETHRVSKFLSLVLRHQPETIGITLDENGWTDVSTLLVNLEAKGFRIDLNELRYVVETNNKKRFAFNADESQIRASQGHSVEVDLGYREKQPPQFLYHGTATQFLELIRADGLKKMSRHHVHLSSEKQTARSVGSRHGKPVVLIVKAEEMAASGHVFSQSENGVWLTDHIPAAYIVHE